MAIVKEMDYVYVSEDGQRWQSCVLLVGMGSGAVSAENSWQFFGPNFTSKCKPKRNENTCLHRCLSMNVYSNMTHRSQKVEITKCLLADEWICTLIHSPTDYHSATRRGEALTLATTWTDPEDTMLSKRSRHRRTHTV